MPVSSAEFETVQRVRPDEMVTTDIHRILRSLEHNQASDSRMAMIESARRLLTVIDDHGTRRSQYAKQKTNVLLLIRSVLDDIHLPAQVGLLGSRSSTTPITASKRDDVAGDLLAGDPWEGCEDLAAEDFFEWLCHWWLGNSSLPPASAPVSARSKLSGNQTQWLLSLQSLKFEDEAASAPQKRRTKCVFEDDDVKLIPTMECRASCSTTAPSRASRSTIARTPDRSSASRGSSYFGAGSILSGASEWLDGIGRSSFFSEAPGAGASESLCVAEEVRTDTPHVGECLLSKASLGTPRQGECLLSNASLVKASSSKLGMVSLPACGFGK